MKRVIFVISGVFVICFCAVIASAEKQDMVIPLGDFDSLENWQGVEAVSGRGCISAPGEAVFAYSDGPKGWYMHGFRKLHDGSGRWFGYHGVQFDINVPAGRSVHATIILETPMMDIGSSKKTVSKKTDISIVGSGWQKVTVPFDSFDFRGPDRNFLYAVKKMKIDCRFQDGKTGEVLIDNVKVVKSPLLNLACKVRSKAGKKGEAVKYEIEVGNCTESSQSVNLSVKSPGWEVMETVIEPRHFILAPYETKTCEVTVAVSPRVPPAGRETQTILAKANGNDAGKVELITISYLEHPYIVHTKEGWDAIRERVKKYDWAKKAADKYIERAEKWKFNPVKAPNNISNRTHQRHLVPADHLKGMFDVAVAYQLTGDKKYAHQVANVLLYISDPDNGYPVTLQGNHNNLVKEGVDFQSLSRSYDLIYNSGALSEKDHQQIAETFRVYQETIDWHTNNGGSGNWQVAEVCGAIYCAMTLQDWATVEYFLYGPGKYISLLTHGIMADGWWYECSIGYNTWVASEFCEMALALKPWGLNFKDKYYLIDYSQEPGIPYADVETRKKDHYGKPLQKWGPVHKPYVTIKDMWDALVPVVDYRGVVFGFNDSTESRLAGGRYELAYYLYRDPNFASIIKMADSRDLLYGVPDLPEDTPKLGTKSAYADNAGMLMLRSQTADRDVSEQITAVTKYGTHGGYHGHFDRTNLTALMRYGRSFYNPEHSWYGYPSIMYDFWVQTTINHNMVVVDLKQQEPVESSRLLFHSGEMMQAGMVETNARWTTPPFGGLSSTDYKKEGLAAKSWTEGRYVPVPEDAPSFGAISDYSDRVLQRRLMIVTDDYVVLADYLNAPAAHIYDNMLQIKGFRGLEAPDKKFIKHTAQMDSNYLLAAQFITDCDWYEVTGPAKSSFEMEWGPGADNAGIRTRECEDGKLKMDVYSIWPETKQVMIGTYPENHGVNKKLWYSVRSGDKTLTEGKFGAWILGKGQIDVSVAGLDEIVLETKVEQNRQPKKTIFWADAEIVTKDGKKIPVSSLPYRMNNISEPKKKGMDYYGGPVKIAGTEYAEVLPAQPRDASQAATITVDLSGIKAVRLNAEVGGDFPLGDETWRTKSYSVRTKGKQARFLTVIEPYEDKNLVGSARALSKDELEVKLKDGRVQLIEIKGIDGDEDDIKVVITERKNGKVTRTETASN